MLAVSKSGDNLLLQAILGRFETIDKKLKVRTRVLCSIQQMGPSKLLILDREPTAIIPPSLYH